MGKIVLEDITEDVLDRLKVRASSTGRTPEQEAIQLLANALRWEDERSRRKDLLRRMEEISAMSPPIKDIDITQLIREDRDR